MRIGTICLFSCLLALAVGCNQDAGRVSSQGIPKDQASAPTQGISEQDEELLTRGLTAAEEQPTGANDQQAPVDLAASPTPEPAPEQTAANSPREPGKPSPTTTAPAIPTPANVQPSGQSNAPPSPALGKSTDGKPVDRANQLRVQSGELERNRFQIEAKQADDAPANGIGPGQGGDKFSHIVENPFRVVTEEPLSTFSIDVDTAAYSKTRMFLMQHRQLPPPDSVRIEELLNYFTYDYQGPQDEQPFAANVEVAECPWDPAHRLVRVGIKGREIENQDRPSSNLVFLLDVSGSMNRPNKLPLVKQGMKMLVDQLGENDTVAIVVYAGAAGLVLPATNCDEKQTIIDALDRLKAGGSTNGGEGIRLAYQHALDNFIAGGTNRVILCSDGDFNVGTTSTGDLVRLAEEQAKAGVFLSVLGFGVGNHNDAMLEEVSGKANGTYGFIDTEQEARKVFIEQMSGTLVTIAKDVKIQIEFNPSRVASFRLIGYENRMLAAQDFNDDKKDAGEIGAGHTVTALYEIVPKQAAGEEPVELTKKVDDLKYQSERKLTDEADSEELLTLKLRYKLPEEDTSKLISAPVIDNAKPFGKASPDFQFAAAVASFGMLLRGSEHKGDANYDAVLELAAVGAKQDDSGYRSEFLNMVKQAKELSAK